MVIIYSDEFIIELEAIIDFITFDSIDKANKFAKDLKAKINKIPDMPYAYVKNSQANNEKVRNLIFKGYTIVFRIGKSEIKILAIFKNNKHKYSNT